MTALERQVSAPGRLRRETSEEHAAIECVPALSMFFETAFTPPHYHALPECRYGFYLPFETELFVRLSADLHTTMAHRRKAPLLAGDLRTAGSPSAMRAWLMTRCDGSDQSLALAARRSGL